MHHVHKYDLTVLYNMIVLLKYKLSRKHKLKIQQKAVVLRLNILCSIQCIKGRKKSYILLYVSENDDGFMKCMELSLED